MWALLKEISEQKEHAGRYLTTDEWKTLFMHACGHETKILPSLDGASFVPYGGRSSHMTMVQMTELIEFIRYWGTLHGVKFRDDEGLTWQGKTNSGPMK